MVYIIQYRKKDDPSNQLETMTIEADPKTLTITNGFIGPDGTAWRIADVDRAGEKPTFILQPQSRARHNGDTRK